MADQDATPKPDDAAAVADSPAEDAPPGTGTVAIVQCVATCRLPGGQITGQGLITFDESQTEEAPFTWSSPAALANSGRPTARSRSTLGPMSAAHGALDGVTCRPRALDSDAHGY